MNPCKIFHSYFFVLTLFWFYLHTPSPMAWADTAPSIQDLKRGVVKITSSVEGKQRVGTGFIVRLESDAASIVTASHVIEGDPHPLVSFFSKPNRPLTAKVIGLEGGDPRGLGALLVEGDIPPDLKVLPLNQSLRVSGGEAVTLIGFPRIAGASWAVTPGTIAGSSGRDLSFTAPADEGNSGGPLLRHGQVIGIITEVAGQFAHATPALIAKFALESWGIKFSDASLADSRTTQEVTSPSTLPSEQEGETVTPPPLDLTGRWRNMVNPAIYYTLEQDESEIIMEEWTNNVFGPALTASGEGQLQGTTLTLSYVTILQTGGKAVLTVSEDGQTMSGLFTDLVSGLTQPLTLSRESASKPQNDPSQFDLFQGFR